MNPVPRQNERTLGVAFLLLTLPFFLNDIGFIVATSAGEWIAVDYSSKLVVVVAIAAFAVLRSAALEGARLPTQLWLTGAMTAAVTLALIALFFGIDRWELDAGTVLQSFFPLERAWLIVFDLTAGLALTAVAEELVFRRLFLDAFATRWSVSSLYVVSSVAFAAIHWSNGVGTIGGAFLAGIALMWLTRRSGTVLPAIIAHYAVNLVLFWP